MAHPLVNNRLVVAAQHCTGEVVDILATAYALGIRITLLCPLEECPIPEEDRAGLENYIYIPELQDESVSERIVTILASQGPFQGIANFVNAWAAMTAKIARELGLRSMSPNVVHRLLDKHTIRQFCRAPSDTVRIDTQGEDLEDLVRLERHLETPGLLPEYPLVVRPCFFGINVLNRLATTSRELTRAIGACCMGFEPGTGLFIDYYEGGPEVEVYLALQDGEVLFSNVVDSFPTSADQCLPKDQKEYFNLPEGHFLKTNLMWPSQLPQKEQDLARDTMYRILLEIGARDGVFQTRARIRNSSVHYADSRGLVDLVPRATPPEEEPSVLALEILPQPSEDLAVYWGERLAHGVDYYALHMLCALGERERFRALARPYGFAGGAAPVWVDYVFTNVGAGLGHPDLTEGLGDVLRRERPDLREQVRFMKYWKSAKVNMWECKTGIFVVISRVSRRRALEVATEIKGMDKIETFMFFPRPGFSSL
ncbi:hypothetical protein PG991_008066 [Apiospora marii]|uniref:BL00235/CARNS1 N-terminal domain-containing protein n=1 Tax=Apiospora marii TaxID=335849 RepID=A0ABR1RWD8_9PEZI